MTLTTLERLQMADLKDRLHAARHALTICAPTKEIEEWVDNKILIKKTQLELRALQQKQAA